MNKEGSGILLAVLAAIISGFAIFANKLFVVDLDPTVFTAVRALLIGGVFFVLSFRKGLFTTSARKSIPWKSLLVIGIIGGGIAFLLFFTGLKLTTSGRAAFLQKTLPLYTTVLAVIFLKEKIPRQQYLALVVMFGGVAAISFATISPAEFWTNPMLGDALILVATVLWAVENIIAKKTMSTQSNLLVTFGRMFFGALVLFGILLLMGNAPLLFALKQSQILNLLASTAILFCYVLTYYWSMRFISVSKASTILLFSPVITLLLGVTLRGEPAPPLQLVGSILIFIGACIVVRMRPVQEQPV